jgi:ribosomal subunit interface protein
MQIVVSGKQIDIGIALKEYVEAELQAAVTKYFEDAICADVVFSKSKRHLFRVDIMVNDGTGGHGHTLIKSDAEETEIYTAFDKACERVEKRLRRYKRKIKDHHKARLEDSLSEVLQVTKYVLSDVEDVQEPEEAVEDGPLIIAEKATSIEELTVSDAVMRMDLNNLPALMFINKKTGIFNVVYRREDGNISWIDASAGLEQKNAA